MPQIRKETYDDAGLVTVEMITIPELSTDDIIAQREAELLAIYEELQALRGQ